MSKKAVPILESLQVRADEKRGSICTTDPKISERLFQNLSEMSVGGTLDNSELQRIHQTHINIVRSAEEALPTRYEDPLTYAWLSILVGEVAQAALELGYELPPTVSLGTVSSGSINAHVISLDPQNSEYLLVFNRQLFDFTDMFARFIASQVADHISEYGQAPSQDRGVLADADCRLLGDLVYFLVNRVAFFRDDAGAVDLIIVVDIDQDPPLAKLTSELSKVFKELLYFSMTSFAVAHELAHIIRLNSKVELPDRGKEEDTNFDEETACDAMACRIAAQAAARQCVGKYAHGWQMVGTVGSLFFLSCLGLVEKAAYVLHHGTDVPQVMTEVNLTSLESNVIFSYPTAVFRRYVGRAVLEDEFRRAGAPELRDWIFGAHDWTAALFDQCWTKLQTRLAGGAEFRKKMRDHGETVRRERK